MKIVLKLFKNLYLLLNCHKFIRKINIFSITNETIQNKFYLKNYFISNL
jgi:hypothetical protein